MGIARSNVSTSLHELQKRNIIRSRPVMGDRSVSPMAALPKAQFTTLMKFGGGVSRLLYTGRSKSPRS
jgi:hypothetical protein